MKDLKVGDKIVVTDVTSKDKLFSDVDNGDTGVITLVGRSACNIKLDNGESLALWKSQVSGEGETIRGR